MAKTRAIMCNDAAKLCPIQQLFGSLQQGIRFGALRAATCAPAYPPPVVQQVHIPAAVCNAFCLPKAKFECKTWECQAEVAIRYQVAKTCEKAQDTCKHSLYGHDPCYAASSMLPAHTLHATVSRIQMHFYAL